MDESLNNRLDSIVEDETRRGYRNLTVRQDIVEVLQEAHDIEELPVPVFRRVRFTKLTAKKKSLINKAVVQRYHADLQDKDLLSSEQLKKLNIERGEWSSVMDKRKQELTEKTNAMMKEIYVDGFDRRQEWLLEKSKSLQTIKDSIQAGVNDKEEVALDDARKVELFGLLERWAFWTPDRQPEYTARYAEEQGRTNYSPDKDAEALVQGVPTVAAVDALQQLEELNYKIARYIDCIELRKELMDLQFKEAKMLADSVEQRRDAAQEMAQLYYCTHVIDEQGKLVGDGKLTPTYDKLWEFPDEVLQYLLVELFFFFEGTPDVDDARDFLEQWGFIAAPQRTSTDDSKPASATLPGEPSSSTDSKPSTETPLASSVSETPTN